MGSPKLRPFLSQNRLSADYKSCSAGTCCKTFASISYKNRRRLLCLEVCNPKQDQRSIAKYTPNPVLPCSSVLASSALSCIIPKTTLNPQPSQGASACARGFRSRRCRCSPTSRSFRLGGCSLSSSIEAGPRSSKTLYTYTGPNI